MINKKVIFIIPARGGSKGIPRKNLRLLGGRPLIYYVINNALSSEFHAPVFVTTDDPEIASVAEALGANVVIRPDRLSGDEVTLDPVIVHALCEAERRQGEKFDVVVTLQPTSPLLRVETLDSAVNYFIGQSEIDTLISAKEMAHLSWRKENDKFLPNFNERKNRQYLPKEFLETGAFLISTRRIIKEDRRIGGKVECFLTSQQESCDVDTFEDWAICEHNLARKKILFVVLGNRRLGMGHVYNSLSMANEILDHDIEFLVTSDSDLAFEKIRQMNFIVHKADTDDLVSEIRKINPKLVINDILDTSLSYMQKLKATGVSVINFEDLGEGAALADKVINAIYHGSNDDRTLSGAEYFLIRDEFVFTGAASFSSEVKTILLCFGGVDPANLTARTLDAIYDFCVEKNIRVRVLLGRGYSAEETLSKFKDAEFIKDTSSVANLMSNSDLLFTSAGRTIFEAAYMQVPTIVIAQNDRELLHKFACDDNGFSNLGLGFNLNRYEISEAFKFLVSNKSARREMFLRMSRNNVASKRHLIRRVVNELMEVL